ncbi:enolase C-terminal domain-like protein [Labedaea rhizosphaerae]|uniref:L-alanine-DL-glutamate epimerase-like enolase superfamily enzyme n=1 Tax=Labedaea rhizosphaerae TaxID=598644 RepID=A0A4R6SHM0_LABRH|nr:enolase C-terminal domain-like protein [Labedaea rhizosphaerae]TDQ00359.1 L-alanine-DL-glutamate epimerase-like enolase superfamily enzyme [Labedaea rhizosphaerae]
MAPTSEPLVDRVTARAYRIPTRRPEADGTLSWDATILVLVRAQVGPVTGTGWTYADTACVPLINDKLAAAVEGKPGLDVPARWSDMQRAIRNLGRAGVVSCALSAVDTALWDAAARLVGVPVSRLLGKVHADVALYASGGFVSETTEELRDWLIQWAHERDVPRVKIKIGQDWGHTTRRDLDRVELARQTVGDDVELYVDANGAYSVGQARRMANEVREFAVSWFEEPVSSDDLAGLATVRSATTMDVAAGEYGYDLAYFARMVDAGAVDCLQIDVTRCGGYTEWMRAAAVAAAANLDVSAHCAPNLSLHAATATQNFRHIEWFADHDRIEAALFAGVRDPSGGRVGPDLTAAGHGLVFKEADAEPYAVEPRGGS